MAEVKELFQFDGRRRREGEGIIITGRTRDEKEIMEKEGKEI
jgi:hypothetical protein